MMNSIANQMLRLFGEDTGSPELRTPELGTFSSGGHTRGHHRNTRHTDCPAAYAWLSYEQLKHM